MIKDRRIGIFRIPSALINDNPKIVMLIMSYMIPIYVEYRHDTDETQYTAICEFFRNTARGCVPPNYDIKDILTLIKNKELTIDAS